MAKNKPPTNSSKSKYTVETDYSVLAHLDPRLQEVVVRQREGQPQNEALARTDEEGVLCVDVIAELKEVEKPVPGLKVVTSAGTIVTGSLDITKVEEARQDPNVTSLKLASKVGPQLHIFVGEIAARESDLRAAIGPGSELPTGKGVIVGIVDYGCDFLHQNFLNADGSKRLLYLWDQTGAASANSPQPYNYGREFNSTEIQAALDIATSPPTSPGDNEDAGNAAYAHLSYRPSRSAHGTHVMDTAAGNGRGTGISGVALEADLIFVDLGGIDVEEADGNFGNSKKLLEAVNYVFEKEATLGKQAVVNLRVGTHGGPHDGSTPAERYFDELLNTSGRAIVVAAGNSRQIHQGHTSETIAPAATRALSWEVSPDDFAPSDYELEVWYPRGGSVRVTLIDPDGEVIRPVMPGSPMIVRNAAGQIMARLSHRLNDSANGDNRVQFLLREPQADGGVWKVALTNTGTGPLSFHAWIERDDFWRGFFQQSQSRSYARDFDPATALNSIGCGAKTIAVASYDARVPGRQISPFSAEGPTRDGKRKPEVAASGQKIFAARSLTHNRRVNISGTSMATPHIAGAISLLMQAARRELTVDEIPTAIITTSQRNPPTGSGWNSRYGSGRAQVSAAISGVLPASPVMDASVPQEAGQARLTETNGEAAHHGFLQEIGSVPVRNNCRVRVQLELEPLEK